MNIAPYATAVMAALAGLFPLGNPSVALAQSDITREVFVNNQCHKPVRVLIRYSPNVGNWVTQGWYSVSANARSSALNANNTGVRRQIQQLSGQELYYYAEATDESTIWSGTVGQGGIWITFNGVRYHMRRADRVVVQGDFSINLTCR